MGIGKILSGKNSKKISDEIESLDNWQDLNNYTAIEGKEFFINGGISGSPVKTNGRVLVRFVNDKWVVPGSDFNTIKYVNENQIFRKSPTIATNTEIFGKNLTFTFGASPLSYFMDSVGKNSSACTFSVVVKNYTNKVAKYCKFLIPTISTNNCSYNGKFAKLNEGTETNPNGTWKNITWNQSLTMTPNDISGSYDYPLLIISDRLEIPEGGLEPNKSIALWFSCIGSGSKEISFVGKSKAAHIPSLFSGGNFGVGNFCNNDPVLFENIDYGQPASHIIFEYEDTTPIVKILTIGDSDFAESVPVGEPTGDGWCYVASNQCATSGINWRITSFAQDGIGYTQFLTRLKSILDSDLKNEFDVIAYQAWTGNEYVTSELQYNSFIQKMNEAKSLTTSAGLGFCTLTLYPACMGQELSSSDQGVREYYENVYSYYNRVYNHMTSGNYDYIDISPVVTSGIDYSPIDSTDGSHALIGTSANPIGQYKQGIALVDPMTRFCNKLGYI